MGFPNLLCSSIATNFCSGESWGLLKFDDFNAPYHAATMDIVRQAKLRKHFPIVQRLMTLIPMGAIAKLNPTIAFHMAMDKVCFHVPRHARLVELILIKALRSASRTRSRISYRSGKTATPRIM